MEARAWRRRRSTARAAVVALACLLAGSLTACGANAPASPRPGQRAGATTQPVSARNVISLPADGSSASPTPAGGRVSAGFVPVSVSAIGSDVWWVLGSTRCGPDPCASVVRTLDGGATFTAIAGPPSRVTQPASSASSLPADAPTGAISDLRFADRRNGWVFGGDLFSTHDGGASWRRVPMPGAVRRLEATGASVWAVVGAGGGYQLYRSAVGEDTWRQVATPIELGPPGPDVALVPDGVAFVDNNVSGAGSVFVSRGGQPFTATWSPCHAGAVSDLEAGEGGLWLLCATPGGSVLARSTDGGAHFTAAPNPTLGAGQALGVAGGDVAVRAAADGLLHRTADGGKSWRLVSVPDVPAGGVWGFVGFTNARVGFAVHASEPKGLWRTTDAGLSYHRIGFGLS